MAKPEITQYLPLRSRKPKLFGETIRAVYRIREREREERKAFEWSSPVPTARSGQFTHGENRRESIRREPFASYVWLGLDSDYMDRIVSL